MTNTVFQINSVKSYSESIKTKFKCERYLSLILSFCRSGKAGTVYKDPDVIVIYIFLTKLAMTFIFFYNTNHQVIYVANFKLKNFALHIIKCL